MPPQTAEGPTVRIPRQRSLEQQLDAFNGLERAEWVARVKELRKAKVAEIGTAQIERINEMTGLDVATALTVLTDGLVRACIRRAWRKAEAPADCWSRAGVFALGGYGRGELAPNSDLDLLVLATGRTGDWLKPAYDELSTLLWDLGFQVGASCRGQHDLEQILAVDHVTATAVLEERILEGDVTVDAALREARERFRKKRIKGFLTYKIEELRGRRSKAGANLYLMEPNLKTNPGCLRDVQFLRNATFMLYGSRNLHALRELDVISFDDVQNIFAANDHFLRLRALLHFQHGRREDVLRLPDQLHLADLLGYSPGGRVKAVEHMMIGHYGHVAVVNEMAELVVSRLHALGHVGARRLILIKTRKRLDDDFSVIDGRVYLSRPGLWEEPGLGRRLMNMCRLAAERRLRLSIELRRDIGANLHRLVSDPFRRDAAVGRCFLRMLTDVGHLRPILEDMHACGLLGTYLPEFGNLRCLLQFNSYHQYTADEHTLIALGNLDQLATNRATGFPGCAEILPRLDRRDLLALSLILHDIGKFMGSGHVPRGALMVGPIAQRMGLDEAEEDLVHFLVEQHVVLSDATRSRDIADPAFLATMARTMGDQRRLDYLYVLTFCDAAAVGEGIVTGWQHSLMKELYDGIAGALKGLSERSDVGASRRQRLHEALAAAGLGPAATEVHLARLPATYQWQAMPEEVAGHLALLAQAQAEGFGVVHHLQGDGKAAISCAAGHRKGMFADLAAALSAANLDVVDARSWSCQPAPGSAGGHILLAQFRVGCAIPARLENDQVWRGLAADMRALAAGATTAAAVLAKRKDLLAANKPANSGFDSIEVRVEQQNSDVATVVDIRIKDGPGLLHLICRSFAEQDCQIEYASISTYGDVARDAFYLTHEGRKLDAQKASQVRAAVETALKEWMPTVSKVPLIGRLDLANKK